jgi:hypothetical protein
MLAALGLVLVGQQVQEIPDVRFLNLKPDELLLPVFAGAKEFVFGIAKQSAQTYSLYVNELEAGHFDSQPVAYSDVLIGFTGWSVTPAVFGSTPCLALSTRAHRNQTVTRGKSLIGLKHEAERTWYVTEEGQILGEDCTLKMATGTWKMEATYGAEEYTATLSAPNQAPRKVVRSPGCGMDELSKSAFVPMLRADPAGKKSEILKADKTFWLLDPFTAVPVQIKAKVRGSFNATLFQRFWTGPQVEFSGYREPYTAWVSHEGVLMRVQLPKGTFLQIENKPTQS